MKNIRESHYAEVWKRSENPDDKRFGTLVDMIEDRVLDIEPVGCKFYDYSMKNYFLLIRAALYLVWKNGAF